MPPIPFADNFLAGSIISLVMPAAVLIAIAVWYMLTIKRIDKSRPSSAPEPVSADTLRETIPTEPPGGKP
jgi:hypothetical protein